MSPRNRENGDGVYPIVKLEGIFSKLEKLEIFDQPTEECVEVMYSN